MEGEEELFTLFTEGNYGSHPGQSVKPKMFMLVVSSGKFEYTLYSGEKRASKEEEFEQRTSALRRGKVLDLVVPELDSRLDKNEINFYTLKVTEHLLFIYLTRC